MSFDAFFTADPDRVGGTGDNPPAPPDGLYEVALLDAGVFTAQTNSRTTMKTGWKVIGAEHAGHEWTSIAQIREGSQESADYFKRDAIAIAGPEVDSVKSMEDLNTLVVAQLGNYYTVEVKRTTRGDRTFENTYIKGRTDGKPPTFAVQGDIPLDTSDFDRQPAGAGAIDDDPASW